MDNYEEKFMIFISEYSKQYVTSDERGNHAI